MQNPGEPPMAVKVQFQQRAQWEREMWRKQVAENQKVLADMPPKGEEPPLVASGGDKLFLLGLSLAMMGAGMAWYQFRWPVVAVLERVLPSTGLAWLGASALAWAWDALLTKEDRR